MGLTRQFFLARQFLPGGVLINGIEIPAARDRGEAAAESKLAIKPTSEFASKLQ
jgi:hypothetical protein